MLELNKMYFPNLSHSTYYVQIGPILNKSNLRAVAETNNSHLSYTVSVLNEYMIYWHYMLRWP